MYEQFVHDFRDQVNASVCDQCCYDLSHSLLDMTNVYRTFFNGKADIRVFSPYSPVVGCVVLY